MPLTGVDISPVQIARARTLVPDAAFMCVDMTAASFPEAGFKTVVSFYAVIHVPVREHLDLFRRVARWLTDGGLFLAVLGHMAVGTRCSSPGRKGWKRSGASDMLLE